VTSSAVPGGCDRVPGALQFPHEDGGAGARPDRIETFAGGFVRRLLCFLVTAVALGGASDAHALRLVASTNDLGAIARVVCGNRVAVEVAASPEQDLHAFRITPENILQARRADLFLSVGLALDPWAQEIVTESGRPTLRILDCSQAVVALDEPADSADVAAAGSHPEGNPHYWLDPVNGVKLARFLAGRLGDLDRTYAAVYRANAEQFADTISARRPAWEERLRGKRIVQDHAVWSYLANRFGVEIVATLEPHPGVSPTEERLGGLAALMKEEGVDTIVGSAGSDGAAREALAARTGARVVVLPTSCVEASPDAYLALFDRVADALAPLPAGQ